MWTCIRLCSANQSRRVSHEENNNGYQCSAGKLIVVPYDSLNLVDNKIVLPGGTKDTLKMLPEFKYAAKCSS
jgi:hypothetical protein